MVMRLTDIIRGTWDSLWRQQGFEACDGIRALSLLAVLAAHSQSYLMSVEMQKWAAEQNYVKAVKSLLGAGEIGVDFFLVLSGFLIGGSMMNEVGKTHEIAWGKFYMRRLFRIVPAYFVTILLSIINDQLHGRHPRCMQYGWKNLLFINNFTSKSTYFSWPCVGISWSISLEMQLYLLTPPIFMLLACLKSKWPGLPSLRNGAIAVCALLCLLSYALRLQYVLGLPKPPLPLSSPLYFQTQYRYSAYAAGVIVGIIVNGSDNQVSKSANAGAFANWAMLVVSLAVVGIVIATGGGDAASEAEPVDFKAFSGMQNHQKMDGLWYRLQLALERPLLDLAAASLTWLCVSGRVPCLARLLGAKVWRPLAALSYSCYLLQFIALELVATPLYRLLPLGNITSPVVRITIFLVGPISLFICTLPFGFILYSLVEHPWILLGKVVISAMPATKPCEAPTKGTVGEIEGTNDDVESQGSTAAGETLSQDSRAHEACQTR